MAWMRSADMRRLARRLRTYEERADELADLSNDSQVYRGLRVLAWDLGKAAGELEDAAGKGPSHAAKP